MADEQPKSKWCDTITIAVSEQEEDENPTLSIVHKHYLCNTSGFFKKALQGPWKDTADAKAERFPLREFDPRYFDAYVHWVYRKVGTNASLDMKIFQIWENIDEVRTDGQEAQKKLVSRMLRFYERASFLQDQELQGAIFRRLRSFPETTFSTNVILDCWDDLPKSSDLQGLLAGILSERVIGTTTDEWPEVVVRDVMRWQSIRATEMRRTGGQVHAMQMLTPGPNATGTSRSGA